jgi:hypothetical protein
MIGGHGHGFVFGCNNDGPTGQMVSLSKQSTHALLNGHDGRLVKDIALYPADGQMMRQILMHLGA